MLRLKRLIFPEQARSLPAQRWLRISLRTLHLIGVSGLGGAFLFEVDPSLWLPYWWLVMISGSLLMLIELWISGIWLLQLAGQAILLKLLLLAAIKWWPAADMVLFIVIIIISGVISHAPARWRHYSIWHRRVL